MLSSNNIGLLLFFLHRNSTDLQNISQWLSTADVNCRRVPGLKIRLQFVKSRHACGFALALPRPRSRGPLDEGAAASSFSDNRNADVRPLGLQVNVWRRVRASCLAAHLHIPEKQVLAAIVNKHGHMEDQRSPTRTHLVRRPRSLTGARHPSWCEGRVPPFGHGSKTPESASDAFLVPKDPPSRRVAGLFPKEFDEFNDAQNQWAHFSQVETSSFGDLTTQIKEETDALDHPGSVDPRRMPTSSARGRTSLACWLKTDTHIQNHTVKFEIAREARTCSNVDAGAVGNLNGLAKAIHEKKKRQG